MRPEASAAKTADAAATRAATLLQGTSAATWPSSTQSGVPRWRPRRVVLLARHPHHLGGGGDAAEDLLHRGLAQRPHPFLAGHLEDLEGGGLGRHQPADLLAHGQDLEDAHAAAVARLPA